MRLTRFESAYIECMLWSSLDDKDCPLDSNYTIHDISNEALTKIKKDCDSFIEYASELLDDIDDFQAGHDFWLTRNRHGAGFWDRGLGDIGDKLTNISLKFGELTPYISDSGKVEL